MKPVSFTVNVCAADAPFAEKTIRHMIRAIGYPFAERLAILDQGKPEGKYTQRHGADLELIQKALDRLKQDKVIDDIIEVPWHDAEIHRISAKYFGQPDMPLRDPDGAPIYQYLFGLDACSSHFLLHADSDMLFHPGESPNWVYQGIEALESQPEVAFVSCGSPPQAQTRIERLTGLQLHKRKNLWGSWKSVSTRYFLTSREKLENNLIPLTPKTAGEALEKTFTHTYHKKGLEHWSLHPRFGWSIHPINHNEVFLQHLDGLIELVEQGRYPFVRQGLRYNLETKGEHFKPWKRLLRAKGLAV